MPSFFRCGLALLACLCVLHPASASDHGKPPQYVIISFDGDLHLEQWERSRALARTTGATFTYFLSCVYLLSPDTREAYRGPGMGAGRTNVGSGFSREDVAGRLRQIWAARLEGHDIASHACGHFDGTKWSENDWTEELDQFRTVVRDAWKINDVPYEPEGWRDFAMHGITGFRAPYLSTTRALYRALAREGFVYDASSISRGPAEPQEHGGIMRFSLPLIPEGPGDRRIIAMDYNMYVRHSGGKEEADKADRFEERAFRAFQSAFEKQYDGARTPLQLGFHFTLMNGGAYWRALERFAGDVCGRSDVHCVSYHDYLEATRPDSSRSASSNG